ncbi:Na(+)-translocating NADH-quinone reductase subunit A [Thalassobius sp. I31.1]|uniref:Na(+)-translocating NADH-quinone reductase subunit A n=1 Tax=Thalassobius sp. I31.1 TaxID=2109912 RepID=UPI000D1B6EFB|nr:Na(+)-translocating NADH-quinone reductase subunit A [Thalassobius sp. I31.1]
MHQFPLKKGLDLPITGAPAQSIADGPAVQTVALLGSDYIGLKPRLSVQEGDTVAAGSPVFAHKDTPDVMVTSPVSGRVKAVNRGARRVLISVEIEVDDTAADPVDFSSVGNADTAEGLAERLAAAGLWTSFRTRPYSRVPASDERASAIYVTAMDSEPLTADPAVIIAEQREAFVKGLEAVAKLTEGKTYLCHATGTDVPGGDVAGVEVATFSGPHPSGLPGTHMHYLEAPTGSKTVWTIWYQDVIAIGHLLMTGTVNSERVIALSGPRVKDPRLVRTVAGASMDALVAGGVDDSDPLRVISGSVLSGRAGEGATAYLGRYHRQITVIEEDHKQIPMGWIRPMFSKFSYQPVLGSALSKKLYALTSNLNGGRRAMVPLGTFEELMPQDYLPTQLLRAMLVMDTDVAQQLGALELDEEDLGLVGFACPAKYEYGMALRDCLAKIEREG